MLPPKTVCIETNTECPSDCIMCPQKKIRDMRRRNIMPTEQVYEIIDRINWDCYVELAWLNEMFTDERVFDFMDRIAEKGLGISIDTNGYLLNKGMLRKVLGYDRVFLNFSIESVNKETYSKIRRGLDFDIVIGNYNYAIEMRIQMKSSAVIWVSRVYIKGMNDTEDETSTFHSSFYSLFRGADKIQTTAYKKRGGEMDTMINGTIPDRNICGLIEDYMAINVDGNVPLCCCDAVIDIPTGNVFNEDILKIWNCDLRYKTIEGIKEHGLRWFKGCKEVI